jgi:hypothetical protein
MQSPACPTDEGTFLMHLIYQISMRHFAIQSEFNLSWPKKSAFSLENSGSPMSMRNALLAETGSG